MATVTEILEEELKTTKDPKTIEIIKELLRIDSLEGDDESEDPDEWVP